MPNQNILIIDDDETIIEILKKILNDNGYDSITASNGIEAVNILQEQDNINGIILDILMPIKDGRETLKEIRKKEKTKNTPVLVLTGEKSITDVSELLTLGANDYMVKPFDPGTLITRLKQILPMNIDFKD